MSANKVAVMAKHPELSKVKTRLAKTIGDQKALEVYNILLEHLCENCLPNSENSFSLGCFITPSHLIADFESLFSSFDFYLPQSNGDLGARMHFAFENMFTELKSEKAILIGADIPNLNRDIIDNAFTKLSSNDIVIGPTDDGGYYLIGMNKTNLELFENLSWGTSTVLDMSLQIGKQLSLKVELLDPLSDIDTEEDLSDHPDILKKMQ